MAIGKLQSATRDAENTARCIDQAGDQAGIGRAIQAQARRHGEGKETELDIVTNQDGNGRTIDVQA